jgi:hypothetical protein
VTPNKAIDRSAKQRRRLVWAAASLVTFILVGQTTAADQAQEAETAKSKAEVLEEKAAPEGREVLPTPAQIITKTQEQAVDPTGEESLSTMRSPVLPAASTGRPGVREMPAWKPSPMSL